MNSKTITYDGMWDFTVFCAKSYRVINELNNSSYKMITNFVTGMFSVQISAN